MTDEEIAAIVIIGACVLLLVVVMLKDLTAAKRRRKRAAVSAQRNEVAARLRNRQQLSAAPTGATDPPARSGPATQVHARSRPAPNVATMQRESPASSLAPTPVVKPRPRIVTRTSPSTGAVLEDPFAKYGERAFSRVEDTELVRHYIAGQSVAGIAVEMQLDTKQIASRLIRLLFSAGGRLDTDDEAPRARRRYETWEIERMREAHAEGVPLERLAVELGRSPLGLGWRMLDLHIPDVPDDFHRLAP